MTSIWAYKAEGQTLLELIQHIGVEYRLRRACGIRYLADGRIKVRLCGITGEAQWMNAWPGIDGDPFEDFKEVLLNVLAEGHYAR